ncbi:hypothetical protein LZ30DRAFT_44622 [Colletotrichum cereale]|nr:hypothetical protein LZ30DRAFT_44622 [Colletotrichum cereale]
MYLASSYTWSWPGHRPWPFIHFISTSHRKTNKITASWPRDCEAANPERLCGRRQTRLGSVIVGLVRPISQSETVSGISCRASTQTPRAVPEAVTISIKVRPRLVSYKKKDGRGEGLCRVRIHPPCSTCVRCATESDTRGAATAARLGSQIRHREAISFPHVCTVLWTEYATG